MSLTALDHSLLIAARTRGHGPARDRAVAAFSQTGQHAIGWLALGAAGAVLDSRRRGRWVRDMRIVAAGYGLNSALKLVVRRPRPQLEGLPPLTATPTRLSFPSAHATTSFAAARLYGELIGAAPLYALALALALSRLYLGVHYPSDVLAGAVLGTVLAIVAGDGTWR